MNAANDASPDAGGSPTPPPTLPAAPPASAPRAEPVSTGAGQHPIGTQSVEHLRDVARRKRRRSRRIALTAAAVLLAFVAAGGVLIVRTYQRDQDGQAAERTERANSEIEAEDDALETARKLDTGEIVNGAANPLDGPESEAEVRDVAPTPNVWAGYDNAQPDSGESNPDSWMRIVIVRWSGDAEPDDHVVEHVYDHDATYNDFVGATRNSETGDSYVAGTDGTLAVRVDDDGEIVQRIFDKQPVRDDGLARRITPDDVLPPEATEFATPLPAPDPATGMQHAFVIDVDRWSESDITSYLEWLGRWTDDGPVREWVRSTNASTFERAQLPQPFELVTESAFEHDEIDEEALASIVTNEGVIVTYGVDDDGHVDRALVHSRELSLRTFYAHLGTPSRRPVFDSAGFDRGSLDWRVEKVPEGAVVENVTHPVPITAMTIPPRD